MPNGYDLCMKWNDRLRQARDAAGVTDTDICAACNVKPPSVHAWMTGKTKNIEGHNLLTVCDLLGVSPHWVIFGTEAVGTRAGAHGAQPIDPDGLASLIASYSRANTEGREQIVRMAEVVAGGDAARAADDQP